MDPASVTMLFILFLATEKAVKYAGGKVADSMTKPIWEALEEKAKWLAGKDDTAKRWVAFVAAFEETRKRLETNGRHPELAKQIAGTLNQFDLKTLPDNQWLDELAIQLEKASLVSEKPDEFLLVELFTRVLPKGMNRAELSETVSDFVSFFQDALFAQPAYKEDVFKNKQWERMREPRYDTRERYIEQVIEHNENLDFVGIPELKDRQALRIEDVFISLQTQIEEFDNFRIMPVENRQDEIKRELKERNERAHLGEGKSKIPRKLTVNQALTEGQKIVVLGDPGSGKTTLLKYIILAYAEDKADKLGLSETKLPIFIRLYDYVAKREEYGKEGFSFTDYLNKYCTDHLQLHLPPDFFSEVLEKGECCVCLDGLDELGAAGIRHEITLAVSALSSRYPRNRFIVTSRTVGYYEAPLDRNDYTHHIIQPLSYEDIKAFIEKWYKARERDEVVRRERTKHLVKTIMNEERIKSLATNPLMLTIIALVHRIEAELPHERVKLYDKCVTTLVETWDKARGMKTALRRRLLEKLAYWMHNKLGEKGRAYQVREGTLRLQLANFLQSDPKNNMDDDQIQKEIENFIDLVKTRSGLLVEQGEDIYTFSHLTFQEYLTACDIEKRLAHNTDALWNEIQPHLHSTHWHEVILLLLGSLNRFEEHNSILMWKIYKSTDVYEPILHRYLFFCAQALSDRVEVEVTLHRQIVDTLLSLAASRGFASPQAFEILGTLQNDSRAASGLLSIARNDELVAYVRSFAAQALGQLGRTVEANQILFEIAANKKVPAYVRHVAARALGQLGSVEEASGLLLVLAADKKVDYDVRNTAAQTLGQLGRVKDAGRLLLELCRDEKMDAYVRREVTQSLRRLSNTDWVGMLLLVLARDEKVDAWVRSAAIQALGQLEYVNKAVLKGLLVIAEDANVAIGVRSAAAQALGQLGHADEAILKVLRAIAKDEKIVTEVRSIAAQSLGQLGFANEAGEVLFAIATDDNHDAFIRSSAAENLGRFGRVDEAAQLLLAIAEDKQMAHEAHSAAAQALGQLGYVNEAVRLLFELSSDEKVKGYIRHDVGQALGQLGRKSEASRTLLALAEDEKEDAWVRSSATQAVGKLEYTDSAVMQRLLGLAENEEIDAYVRIAAVQSLGQLGRVSESVLIGLLTLVEDDNVNTRIRYLAYAVLRKLMGLV